MCACVFDSRYNTQRDGEEERTKNCILCMFTSIDTCSARKSLIHFVWRALFFPPFASAIRIQSGLMLLIQNEMHLKFQLLSALAKYKFECAEKKRS